MSSEQQPHLVVVDGREALAYVIVRPGQRDGTVSLEAGSKGLPKPAAAHVLRNVADKWAPRPGLDGVLTEVAAERAQQDARWGEQNHPDGTGSSCESRGARYFRAACQAAAANGAVTWAAIAREEDYEAFAESDPARLRAELIQSIAVRVAWIEAIDRRTTQAAQQEASAEKNGTQSR
ncbi:NUDIX hydrolase [Streptomyces sp. NPDC048242]|uniref:NUDIX hydrolase n=1 Tax=Streptomyces sp. NPDC048242 TaxID=3155026 RepID=UPI00343E0125